MNNINTIQYWENRHSTDWESRHGIEQSDFFAEILINNVLPRVLYETESMLDFGCAMGQLCNKWKHYTGTKNVFGYDFSAVACEKASQLYPDIDFGTIVPKQKFDTIISSNVLEHVDLPIGYLHRFTNMANKFVVLLLPYNTGVFDEHVNSFDENSFPQELNNFVRIQTKIIQCDEPLLWTDKQLMLVYKAC